MSIDNIKVVTGPFGISPARELYKVLHTQRAASLTIGITGIVENNESRQATRIVLVSLMGALIKKGDDELAEKVCEFVSAV
jgi:hypothetical protein